MKLLRRLMLEQLEDRCLFAVLGVPWPEASKITLSFAPDGARAGDMPSELFGALSPRLASEAWQTEILRAAQTWIAESNINIGLVGDSGQPFQSLGFKQGDLRFGDIRIGAFPMGDDVLAVANPYDPFVVNTWVGDIFLNSKLNFAVTADAGDYDLYSVMLHEMGHVLGVAHSDDPSSPMYGQFHTIDTGLTATEIASIRQLYGARKDDVYDAAHANGTLASATPLMLDSYGEASLAADITRAGDVDVYQLEVPSGATSLDIDLHAAGLSLLEARLTLVDALGRVLATSAASDPRQNDLSVNLSALSVGGPLYVKVESAVDHGFAIGAYELEINASRSPANSPADTPPSPSNSGGMQAALDTAEVRQAELLATTPGYVEHTYYEIDAELSNLHPEHVYRVRSADLGPDITNVMTVIVDTYGSHNVQTAIYDNAGNLMQAQVIAQTDDEIALQVSNVASNRDYLVRVHGENYVREAEVEVEVDFAHDSTHLQQLVAGSLAAGEDAAAQPLTIGTSELVHWVLSASDWSQVQETGVEMELWDAAGNIVYTLGAPDGASRSGEVFLNAGSYTAHFARTSGDIQTPVIFKLSGMTTSAPIGPQLRDTTRNPVDSNGNARTQLFSYWVPTVTNSVSATAMPVSIPSLPTANAGSFGASVQPVAQMRAAVDTAYRPQVPLSVKSAPARKHDASVDLLEALADRRQPLQGLRKRNPAVTPAIEAIVLRCLQYEPKHRYASARQLQEDLQRQLDHRALRYTREPSLVERTKKWLRRHPRISSGSGVASVAVVLLALIGSALLVRSQRLATLEARGRLVALEHTVQSAQVTFLDVLDNLPGAQRSLEAALTQALTYFDKPGEGEYLRKLSPEELRRARAARAEALFLQAAELSRQADLRTEEAERARLWKLALDSNHRASQLLERDARPEPALASQASILSEHLGRSQSERAVNRPSAAAGLTSAHGFGWSAALLTAQRRFREARPQWENATRAEPQNVWTWYGLGHCYERLAEHALAAECYSACIALAPEQTQWYFRRGLAHLNLQLPALARDDFTTVLTTEPEHTDALINRALAHLALHAPSEAIEDLSQAIALGNESARVLLMRAQAREQAGDSLGAERDRHAGVARSPDDEQGWTARGVLRAASDPRAAMADFDQALRINPGFLPALESKAHVLAEQLDDASGAIRLLDEAISRYPEESVILAAKGVLLARQGKANDAKALAAEALASNSSPSILYQVAGIYALVSQDEETQRERALSLLAAALRAGFGAELIGQDHDFDPLRADPRFERLLSAVQTLTAVSEQARGDK